MAKNLKNITFSLPIELIEKMKEYAKNNEIPSLNVAIAKERLEEKCGSIEDADVREQIKKLYTQCRKESGDGFI